MSSHFKGGDGDWICSDLRCGNLNFARRSSCNRCGKQKEISSDSLKKKQGIEIGKVAAEKSHGLFSAEDWQCSKCGNVNWARRQTCNMCNAPKVGEVEERTGYGGGFNEREGVEYIERDESDDEFDEFGRRKKKFRTGGKDEADPKPKVSPIRDNVKKEEVKIKDKGDDGNEEDEEDDEDEEDLSKYDLWQDDGEDEAKDKPEEESKSTKEDQEGISRPSKNESRSSSSSSPNSRYSSHISSRDHSSSKDQSPNRESSRRSPKRYRDRSRSRERRRNTSHRSSDSRSRSLSRSRSRSRERKYSRR